MKRIVTCFFTPYGRRDIGYSGIKSPLLTGNRLVDDVADLMRHLAQFTLTREKAKTDLLHFTIDIKELELDFVPIPLCHQFPNNQIRRT